MADEELKKTAFRILKQAVEEAGDSSIAEAVKTCTEILIIRTVALRQEISRLQELVRLRAGYILGACQGEEEMKAEAQAMLNAIK